MHGLLGKNLGSAYCSWNLSVHPSLTDGAASSTPSSPLGIDPCPQAPSQSQTAPRSVGKLTSENMCHVLLSHSCCAAGPSLSPAEGNTNRRTAGGDGGQVKQKGNMHAQGCCTCTRTHTHKYGDANTCSVRVLLWPHTPLSKAHKHTSQSQSKPIGVRANKQTEWSIHVTTDNVHMKVFWMKPQAGTRPT